MHKPKQSRRVSSKRLRAFFAELADGICNAQDRVTLAMSALSFFNAAGIACSQYSADLCGELQTRRAATPANSVGNNFASIEPYTVPTPVWSVNAPTARLECSSTGKRNRFSFIRAIV